MILRISLVPKTHRDKLRPQQSITAIAFCKML